MIRVKSEKDQVNIAKVYEAGQEHIFRWWDELSPELRRRLLDQIDQIDFQLLSSLAKKHIISPAETTKIKTLRPPSVIKVPAPTPELKEKEKQARSLGEQILASKKVAIFMAAGECYPGDEDLPLGFVPIGPVSQKPLYEWHGEKIAALSERYRWSFPWVIMISDKTEKKTLELFEKKGFFGLSRAQVRFVKQKMLPILNRRGKILLKDKSTLCFSTNGYGGAFYALQSSELLEEFLQKGIEYLFYFQVENPLVKVVDPLFLGYHAQQEAEVSTKVIMKRSGDEHLDVATFVDGSLEIVLHSELSEEERNARTSDGNLTFSAGNTAIHIFSLAFLKRLAQEGFQLPYHKVETTATSLHRKGEEFVTKLNEAVQFELFLFDVLSQAKKKILVETPREEEYAPVLGATGAYSPEKSRQAIVNYFRQWIQRLEEPWFEKLKNCMWEISPRYALDEEAFQRKFREKLKVHSR